jgi:hypothetical protein
MKSYALPPDRRLVCGGRRRGVRALVGGWAGEGWARSDWPRSDWLSGPSTTRARDRVGAYRGTTSRAPLVGARSTSGTRHHSPLARLSFQASVYQDPTPRPANRASTKSSPLNDSRAGRSLNSVAVGALALTPNMALTPPGAACHQPRFGSEGELHESERRPWNSNVPQLR